MARKHWLWPVVLLQQPGPECIAAANSFTWRNLSRNKPARSNLCFTFTLLHILSHSIQGSVKKGGDSVCKWVLAKTPEWPSAEPKGCLSAVTCCGDVSHKGAGRPDCFRSASINFTYILIPLFDLLIINIQRTLRLQILQAHWQILLTPYIVIKDYIHSVSFKMSQ